MSGCDRPRRVSPPMSFNVADRNDEEGARDVQELVRELPLFRDLDQRLKDALIETIEWFALPGGTTLFEDGDTPDALYFVINGSLGAYQTTPDGFRRLVGRIASGETVGEMALISGKPRSATVVALRDTELARVPRSAFEQLMLSHPQGLLRISQLMVQRLDSSQRQTRGALRTQPRTIAIVPNSAGVDAAGFAASLTTQLAHLGRAELVLGHRGAAHTSHWFHAMERANEFVLYVCDVDSTSWSKLCLRQSDAVLLLADADSETMHWPVIESVERAAPMARRMELVLMHRGQIAAGTTHRWLDRLPGTTHHHVRHERDVARVARLLSGRGLGVVLSGGGARGFAHLGVLRAMREANIAIDAIGGTSIGAIIAAGFALEWTDIDLLERVRRSFVDTNPLNDYTLPLVALVSGRKVTRLLRREFESIAIEDMPLPFFCVSSNLTSGRLAVHRRGELWRWLRASVAIPGVLPPVVHQGELFVDGASINNLPVEIMREAGLGTVIGIDVGADPAFTSDDVESDAPPFWKALSWFKARKHRVNILQILWRAGTINSAGQRAAKHEMSDLLLQPPLEQIDLLNWRGFDRAIEAGYVYAKRRLEEWSRERLA
jgi:NTE family protein